MPKESIGEDITITDIISNLGRPIVQNNVEYWKLTLPLTGFTSK